MIVYRKFDSEDGYSYKIVQGHGKTVQYQ